MSLLTHLTPEDISHLQTVGKDAQEARKEFILRDDQEAVWEHVKSMKGERVDFILDNGATSAIKSEQFIKLTLCGQLGSRSELIFIPLSVYADLDCLVEALHRSCVCGFPCDIHALCIESCLPVRGLDTSRILQLKYYW